MSNIFEAMNVKFILKQIFRNSDYRSWTQMSMAIYVQHLDKKVYKFCHPPNNISDINDKMLKGQKCCHLQNMGLIDIIFDVHQFDMQIKYICQM